MLSPNDQFHMVPAITSDESVKLTVSGTVPEVTSALNAATGAATEGVGVGVAVSSGVGVGVGVVAAVTVMKSAVRLLLLPAAFDTVRFTG